MKILPKMIIGFLLVVLISLISGVFTMNLIDGMNSDIDKVHDVSYPINKYSTNYQRGANLLWIGTYIFANGDEPMGKQFIRSGKLKMEENREKLAEIYDADVISEMERKENTAIEASEMVVNNVKDTEYPKEKIQLNLNFLQQRVDALNLGLSSLVDESQENMIEDLADAKANANNAINLTLIAIFASLVLSLIVAFLIATHITRPVKQLKDVADKVTDGKFDTKLPEAKSNDEISELTASMEMLVTAFKFAKDGPKGGKK